MKKLLLIGTVLATIFCANAASYRQFAALDKGLNPVSADTATITYNERIAAMYRIVAGNGLDSIVGARKTDYNNYTIFSDGAFYEFLRRAANGGMVHNMNSLMLGSSNVNNNLNACTDAQLLSSFLNRMWGLIVDIQRGF
jgi:hypothetical protein